MGDLIECPTCNGDGEMCAQCQELADNCDCPLYDGTECQECGGIGEIESDEDKEEEAD